MVIHDGETTVLEVGQAGRWAERSCVEHELKSWPELFEPLLRGMKTHDLRRSDDRDFAPGDLARFREYDPRTRAYTGRECWAEITYVTSAAHPCALSGEGLDKDFCILSVRVRPAGARQ